MRDLNHVTYDHIYRTRTGLPKNGVKDEHESNCLNLIKFKNQELSGLLDRSIAALEKRKRAVYKERETCKAKVAKARAELESIKYKFKNVTDAVF